MSTSLSLDRDDGDEVLDVVKGPKNFTSGCMKVLVRSKSTSVRGGGGGKKRPEVSVV